MSRWSNREAHREQIEYINERRKLEDEMRDLRREWAEEQHKFAEQSLALQAQMIDKSEDAWKLQIAQAQRLYEIAKQLADLDFGNVTNLPGQLSQGDIEAMEDAGLDDVYPGGGSPPPPDPTPTPSPYPTGPGPIPIQFGGPVIPSEFGNPMFPGRDQSYLVGEGGRPEIFIPDSAGRVTPFNPGGGLVEEFFSQVGQVNNLSGALVVISALVDLVKTLDQTNPDRAREVDSMLKVMVT